MLIQFDHEFDLPVEEAYPYFRTPKDWPRLFASFGEVEDRGQGWYAVPLHKFPFPLVAKITRDEPLSCVEWVFKGFWRGEGQVSFVATSRGVAIRGFERISARPLGWLAPRLEPLLLEKRFQRVWESGWRHLRREATSRITEARFPPDWEAAHELVAEYAVSLDLDLSFQGFAEELEHLSLEYGPPSGVFFLARIEGRPAGCVGLHRWAEAACEMKRLYVRPQFRGLRLGRALAERSVRWATQAGYSRIVLDTLPGMGEAQHLYVQLGFRDIASYRFNPVPGTRFMALSLKTGPGGDAAGG